MFDQADTDIVANTTLKVVDLFAGAGGFSLAATQCGCKVVCAVENDRHAVNTYRQNFVSLEEKNQTIVYDESILDLSAREIGKAHFSKTGECDLMLGGPPCQGFSAHRLNDAGVGDPRNELIHCYFEFVKRLGPKAFLMENVPGILWNRHSKHLETLYSEGATSGYHLYPPVVLDAKNFGVPQSRKRVFILGVQSDAAQTGFVWPPKATHASKVDTESSDDLTMWLDCKHVFKRAPKGDPNNVHMKHGETLTEVFKNTPKNGGSRLDSGRILPCHKNHKGHKDVYGRIDPRKSAPTMTAGCSNPSKGRFVHPEQHHGITMRQAARIQTFPDSFVFTGGLTATGKQIGNAVPVKLGEVLIEHIKKSILSNPYFESKRFRSSQRSFDD